MDGPVIASLISSSVAVLVAVGSAIRADVQRASDRRYERRRLFLMDAQHAALVLRDALRAHGQALRRTQRTNTPELQAELRELRMRVATAGGALAVAASRVEDSDIVDALARWERLARETLIDVRVGEAPNEDAAFTALNRLIGTALRVSSLRARR